MYKSKVISVLLAIIFLLTTVPGGSGLAANTDGTVTFTTKEIPLSDPEIANPMRGFHFRTSDPNFIMSDTYERFSWRELEPQKDVYDFSKIEAMAEIARKNNGVTGFRVRCVSTTSGGTLAPDYIMKEVPKGWFYDYDKDGTGELYIPDWNDEYFLERAAKLLSELGKKFNNDPRIGWIDVGIYGNYGEWHTSPFGENRAIGAYKATEETLAKIIDFHIKAFPDKRIIMLSDNDFGLRYALSASPEVGFRRDSFMMINHFEKDFDFNTAKDRWKTAPVILEPIDTARIQPELAIPQAKMVHASAINKINYRFANNTEEEKELMFTSSKIVGYRYVLNSVMMPETSGAGVPFNITANWMNSGLAPAYLPWNVTFQLRGEDGKIVWQGVSSLNLMNLLPEEKPAVINDSFILPAGIPGGIYHLAVVVADPGAEVYFKPMALAIYGRQEDGSYILGRVNVKQGTAAADKRVPVAKIDAPAATKVFEYAGLSAAGSYSPDDYITDYRWEITSAAGFNKVLYGASQKIAFLAAGEYKVVLTVKDSSGNETKAETKITAEGTTPARPTPKPANLPLADSAAEADEAFVNEEPASEPLVIEDFEGDVSSWSVWTKAGKLTYEIVNDTPDGTANALKADYDWESKKNTSRIISKPVTAGGWGINKYDAIRFWIKGSESNGELGEKAVLFEFKEKDGNGEKWSYDLSSYASSPEWQQVTIPFSELFSNGGTANDGKFTLKHVFQIQFTEQNSTKPVNIYLDNIELISTTTLQ